MPAPRIEILGVYEPSIPIAVYWKVWESTRSVEQTKAHFKELALLETQIEHIDSRFNMADLRQAYTRGDYPDHFQCAYDEALLSLDGEAVIERSMNSVREPGLLRFAFYLHFFDANRPLQWSYGEVQCPIVKPLPRRLKKLVPYRGAPNSW